MIISASRRTDIPAFYSQWFMNQIRAGFCTVPNPFNPRQISRVSLRPEEVDVILFWTRNPLPLLPSLPELDQRGFWYLFLFTLLDYPAPLQGRSPTPWRALAAFQKLAAQVGPEKVAWRYDPLVFSNQTGPSFHGDTYARLAAALKGCRHRSVTSLVNLYRRNARRLEGLAGSGISIIPKELVPADQLAALLPSMAQAAGENGMILHSCAESLDLRQYGIEPGKCIDDRWIRAVFGIDVPAGKDPGQRPHCGCVVSKDVGRYDTCLHGCPYCYAVASTSKTSHAGVA